PRSRLARSPVTASPSGPAPASLSDTSWSCRLMAALASRRAQRLPRPRRSSALVAESWTIRSGPGTCSSNEPRRELSCDYVPRRPTSSSSAPVRAGRVVLELRGGEAEELIGREPQLVLG